MSIQSNFPLSVSDQAEVIRIFLELMAESHRAGRTSGPAATNHPLDSHASHDSRFPSELLDLE